MNIPTDALIAINQLAARERLIKDLCDEWWNKYVDPLLDECDTWDEAREVLRQIKIVDQNGSANMPGNFSVNFAYAHDRFTYGDKAPQQCSDTSKY